MQVSTKHRRCIASAVLAATSATQFVEALQLHQNGFTTAVGRFGKTMKTKLNDVVSRSGAVVPDDKFSQEFDNEDRWTKKWKRVAEERKRQIGKGKIPSYDFMTAFSEGLRLPKRMLTSEQRQKIYAKAEQYAVDAIYAEQSDNLHPKHWTTPDVSIFSLWQLDFDFFETSVHNYIFGPPTDSQDTRVILNKSVDQPLKSALSKIYRKTSRKYIKHEETPFATNLYFKAASIAKFDFFSEEAIEGCEARIAFLQHRLVLQDQLDYVITALSETCDEADLMDNETSWFRAFDYESVTQEDRSLMHLAIRIRRYNAIVAVLSDQDFHLEDQIPEANFLLAHFQIKKETRPNAVVEHDLYNRAVQITLQDHVFEKLNIYSALTKEEWQLVANHATFQFKDIMVQPRDMLKRTTDAYQKYSAFVDEFERRVNAGQYNFLDSLDVVQEKVKLDIDIEFDESDNKIGLVNLIDAAIESRYMEKTAETKADVLIFEKHMNASKEDLKTLFHVNKCEMQLTNQELQVIDDAFEKQKIWSILVEACESTQYDFLSAAEQNVVLINLETAVKRKYQVSNNERVVPRFEQILEQILQHFFAYQQHLQGEVFFTAYMHVLDLGEKVAPSIEQVQLVYDDLNDTPTPLTEQQRRFILIFFPFEEFRSADHDQRASYPWWRQTHQRSIREGIVKAFLQFYARYVELRKLLKNSGKNVDDVHKAAVSAQIFFPHLTPMQQKMIDEYFATFVDEGKLDYEMKPERWDRKWARVAEGRRKQRQQGILVNYDFVSAFTDCLDRSVNLFTEDQVQRVIKKAMLGAVVLLDNQEKNGIQFSSEMASFRSANKKTFRHIVDQVVSSVPTDREKEAMASFWRDIDRKVTQFKDWAAGATTSAKSPLDESSAMCLCDSEIQKIRRKTSFWKLVCVLFAGIEDKNAVLEVAKKNRNMLPVIAEKELGAGERIGFPFHEVNTNGYLHAMNDVGYFDQERRTLLFFNAFEDVRSSKPELFSVDSDFDEQQRLIEEAMTGDLQELGSCPISFVPLDQEARHLSCNEKHRFQKSAIIPWLKSHGTCPLCREHVEDKLYYVHKRLRQREKEFLQTVRNGKEGELSNARLASKDYMRFFEPPAEEPGQEADRKTRRKNLWSRRKYSWSLRGRFYEFLKQRSEHGLQKSEAHKAGGV